MFDAIVVGARCAGAPTALLLSRAGYRVLLLDKEPFGTDTLSTHLIHQPGVAALARWGLLDAIRASGCPPLDRVSYDVAGIRLEGCSRGVEGQRAGFAPRRHILDALLVEAAAAAGAEVRDRCRVTGLLRDEQGRVVGVEGRHGGRAFTERARLVIGADGMRSTVARLAQAPYTVSDPRLTCAYYTYWEGVPASLELHEGPDSWVAAVATHDAATLVLAYFPQSRFEEVRTDARRAYREQIRATAPALDERLAGRKPLERLRGTGDQQNFFRRPTGPGWVLVGDAGHHKDSITARGISDAFLQVEDLVRGLDGRLGGNPAELDAALAEFAEKRDEALLPGYEATLGVAQLTPHEQRLSLLRAVGRDPELTAIYFDMVAGIETASALYTPRLLALL
ncbi:FAD-dependent oxidoreductase [Streptomyces nodosus]|uniref:FAD-dependent monooxygenase n=1 Tax=Streptomyces nodosus TaxID=40318 RepID=A0A0B5DV45_9ACTN|nr:FAD-dependent monooxygenase [Streptomyces nodosus]AJE44062.1 FAD-dependent oxidoreductase [Streptomyces nodosus]MBB4795644.1 2-polyprenyl-6-methoxyphenol hydroxylase-like FAD-dependent oxidoreductase [Streptomyces nodosus]QEV42553.1 FAD-dependent monooxygenase [Streptomyces nodosus]